MLTRALPKIAVAVFLLVGLAHPCAAEVPKVGLTLGIQGDGILDPVVTKISVTKVERGSLAETAGIVSGDEIIEIEGQPVVGRRGRELQSLMKFAAGETRTLRLKHVDGKQFEAKLIKPKE